METIFDFGVTDKELQDIFGINSKEKYLSGKERSYDSNIMNIAYLLMYRGDERWKQYADKLPWDRRQEVYRDSSE